VGKCRRHFRHGKRRRASNPCSSYRIKRYMRRCDVRCCEINPASFCFNFKTQVLSFSSYEVDNRGIVVRCREGAKDFSRSPVRCSGTQKTLTGALSLGLMQPVREADRLLLPIAKANNGQSPISILPYVFVTSKITP